MKRTLLILLSVVCVLGCIYGQETISKNSIFADRSINGDYEKEIGETTPRVGKYAKEYEMMPGETLQEAVAKSAFLVPSIGEDDLEATFSTTLSWGTVYAIDPGSNVPETLFYTKELTVTDVYYYSDVNFTFYDSNFNQLYEIGFDLPYKCNDARVLENFSGAFWDNTSYNNSLEFVFMVHYFKEPGGPDNQIYDHYVYTVKDGSRIATLSNVSGISQYYNANNSLLIVDNWLGNKAETVELNVYKSRTYIANIENPTVLASHEFNLYTTISFDGPFFDHRTVDGVDYYCFAHYELPYYSELYPNWTVEENNKFILDFYKTSDCSLAKKIEIPIVQEDIATPIEASFGMGFREFDITTKVFNDDEKWEIIYAKNQYVTAADEYFPLYFLINEDGDVLKELPFMISSAIKLSDIANYETQYAVTHNAGGGITAISFLDLPSWEIVGTFNARHNGELLSLNFNRYPVDDKYAYVFAMGESFQEDDQKFNKVNWYNPDGTLHKEHRIYMEGDDYFFEAMVGANTLNPYLFNTDEKMEYIGFCGTYIEGNNTLISARIYNEDSELLFSAADKGDSKISAGLYTVSNGRHWEYFIITYSTNSTSGGTQRTYDFYELPLLSLSEGDGTPANPYVIKNAGDFDQIRSNPAAAYVVVDDIDMSNLLAVKYSSGWNPIPSFSGTLDAKGHTIRGFNVSGSSSSYLGLFAEISIGNGSECWIKNLNVEDAELHVNSSNLHVGILAGRAAGNPSTENIMCFDNINITGKIINGNTYPTSGSRGGIIGDASYNSTVQNSSFVGSIESSLAYGSASIGGIIGKANNKISVKSSYTKGEIAMINGGATGSAGGVVGNLGAECLVKDSYSTMNVSATNQVGGVVGYFNSNSKKGLVENCYATGVIVANNSNQTAKTYAGGIIGSTDYNKGHMEGYYPNQTVNKFEINQRGLVALGTKVTATNGRRVAGDNSDSDWISEAFGSTTLDSIKNVYAIADLLIGSADNEVAISSSNNESTDGADITANDLKQTFYAGIGWGFGDNIDSPWVWNDNGNPRLYTEYKVKSVSLNAKNAVIDLQETLQLTATVTPEEAWNVNVSWTSSSDAIATVDENGLVTGINFGTVIITATTEDGEYTATCEVKVGKVEELLLNKSTLDLVAGKDETLVVSTTPEGSALGELIWSSSDKKVAIVDSNGRVTGVAIGNCTITVTMKDTDLSASCAIKVKAAESVSLNKKAITLEVGANETLIATIDPVDALYTDLTWESSNNSVATVNAFGKVTAIGNGVCTIKVKLDGTSLFDTCKVTVQAPNAMNEVDNNPIRLITGNGYIKISSEQIIEDVKIYTTNGRLVYASKDASTEIEVPVSNWNKGVYVVKAISGNQSYHLKALVK